MGCPAFRKGRLGIKYWLGCFKRLDALSALIRGIHDYLLDVVDGASLDLATPLQTYQVPRDWDTTPSEAAHATPTTRKIGATPLDTGKSTLSHPRTGGLKVVVTRKCQTIVPSPSYPRMGDCAVRDYAALTPTSSFHVQVLSTSLDSISSWFPTNSPWPGYPCHVSGPIRPRLHTALSSFPSPCGYVLPNGLYLVARLSASCCRYGS